MKLWFRAKNYGWGWYPSSWQGWVILLLYILLMGVTGLGIDGASHSVSDTLMIVAPLWVLYTCILLLICIATGEKPRWRWGKD